MPIGALFYTAARCRLVASPRRNCFFTAALLFRLGPTGEVSFKRNADPLCRNGEQLLFTSSNAIGNGGCLWARDLVARLGFPAAPAPLNCAT